MRKQKIPKHVTLRQRDALVKQYYRLPDKVYWSLRKNPVVGRLDYDEMRGYGLLGLVKAANTWNPKLGWKFITYAWSVIQNHLVNGAEQHLLVRVPRDNWFGSDRHNLHGWRKRRVAQVLRPTTPLPYDCQELCVYDGVWEPGEVTEDALDLLNERLSRLTRKRREALLYWCRGLRLREIGLLENSSKQAVQQNLWLGLRKLRELYGVKRPLPTIQPNMKELRKRQRVEYEEG